MPSSHYSQKARETQQCAPDQVFYRNRRKFDMNSAKWRRDRKVGPEWRLLREIAIHSLPSDPFCWVVTGTQKEWAESWGMSLATLQRHLKSLRDQGLLEGTVRTSVSLRSRSHKGIEYPVFRIPDHVVDEVSRWCDPDFWPAQELPRNEVYRDSENQLCKPQNEVYSDDAGTMAVEDGPTEKPAISGVSLVQGNKSLSPLINRSKEEGREKVVLRENRRLRRRSTTMKRKNDEYDPPVIGADPDRKQEPEQRRETSTVTAERAFDDAWQKMLNQNLTLRMRLPLHPWASGTKAAFRGWLKNQFLPEIDGDLERAERIFNRFCSEIQTGSDFIPGQQPPYRRLQRQLDKYARLCQPERSGDESKSLVAQRASRFDGGSRRRPSAPKTTKRTDSQFFLD